MTARLSIVAAVAENRVIGRDDGLPWRLPSDLKRFRAITMGKPIVMGRRTFESIGRPLDGRDNIVITRNVEFASLGVHIAYSLDEAMALGEGFSRRRNGNEICIIGGNQLFAETLMRADVLHLTEVHDSPDGDVFFPEVDWSQWRETAREGPLKGQKDSASVSFVTYERILP